MVMKFPSHSIQLLGCQVKRWTFGTAPARLPVPCLLWRRPTFSALGLFRIGELVMLRETQISFSWHFSYSVSMDLISWLLDHVCDSLVPLHILSKYLYSCWSPKCFISSLSLWFLRVVFLHMWLGLFFPLLLIVLHFPFPGSILLAGQKQLKMHISSSCLFVSGSFLFLAALPIQIFY